MITQDSEIYAIGKGFVTPDNLTPGDRCYTLDSWRVEVGEVSSISSDFISQKINVINSGQNNVDATPDARYLYGNGRGDSRLVPWEDIPKITPDKSASETKYCPILSWPAPGDRLLSDRDLEYVARMVAYGREAYDLSQFYSVVNRVETGQDAQVLIDMLEFWASESPGTGRFDRVSVKARTHKIHDKRMLDELCRVAVLAGFTASVSSYNSLTYALKVYYESMPVPGSIPRNQKYSQRHYTGLVYNIDVGNKPVMGRTKNRVFYIPCSSILNNNLI